MNSIKSQEFKRFVIFANKCILEILLNKNHNKGDRGK
jgi:hypothetical protein